MAEVDKILIVGGGIAGLALATALSRHGFAPRAHRAQPGLACHRGGLRERRDEILRDRYRPLIAAP